MKKSHADDDGGENARSDTSVGPRAESTRRPVCPGGRGVRLDDAITYFLGEWPSEGPTQDTVRGYTGQLKWLAGFAHRRGNTLLEQLTPELMRAALLQKQDPRNHSLNYKGGEQSSKALLCATRKLLHWLELQGVPVADLSSVRSPRPPERIQPRLRQDEFQAIETSILHRLVAPDRPVPRLAIARDLALIYLMADTGLRASEICGMDCRDVDFSSGSVLVYRGKGKKQRALSIVDPNDPNGGITLRLLADWIEMRKSVRGAARNTKLWVSMKGNPLNRESLRRILLRICIDADIDGNRPPHAFRRASFTERYLEAPQMLHILASRMGWSDKNHYMVDVYTRGARVDLARTTPVASLSARWRESPKAPIQNRHYPPMLERDVGLERLADGRPSPTVAGETRERPVGKPRKAHVP